jgi:serine/threonine protein kinase
VNLLCPACHTPLPAAAGAIVTCPTCCAEVDVTRAGTVAGRPRFVPEIDRTGTVFGGYALRARLGSGGMGMVYRATGADGREVALKLLSPALAPNPGLVSRFAREVSTLERLDHPAIVRVLAHGTDEGIPWFAMELIAGSDLRARIARGALAPGETAAIFARLFAALGHAHGAGVVHRDLKPANVLLAADGARLADFGIARWDAEGLVGSEVLTRLTETAAVIGTLPYMSPEQRRGGAIDRRADLFSAGVMLYEAATGALPQGAFPPPSEINSAYGRAFDRVVLRLLQPDPSRRPGSADEVAAALDAALAPRGARSLRLGAQVAAIAAAIAVMGMGGRAWLRRPHGATAASSTSTSSSSSSLSSSRARIAPPRSEATAPSPVPLAPDAAAGALVVDEPAVGPAAKAVSGLGAKGSPPPETLDRLGDPGQRGGKSSELSKSSKRAREDRGDAPNLDGRPDKKRLLKDWDVGIKSRVDLFPRAE